MAAGGVSAPTSSTTSVVVCCGIPLPKKRNATRVVWDYFGLKAGSDGRVVSSESQVPVCRLCGKSVPAKGGNTTNLPKLRRKVPLVM